jgi:hypothetical protein
VDRPDAVSSGVTESEAIAEVLGADTLTEDRKADLIRAIRRLEDLADRIPLLWRILYHGLYEELHPENSDVWLRVGEAASRDPVDVRDQKWRHKIKSQAWRRAHPPGLEVEPPE